ncbi:NCS1 family nucleobase:cation symporter-1 [Streptomyces muensis]|uniref:NCS1 family nucleobase:cation symporter-1 n=1 Tax=Streptomyces muensis TaxID=1077944 RepID=A0A9X1Q260_STRM4|nr:NCS1 family nucleobase:cation symporter-1 [Streptomyces muensis]MCF1597278.1 NCS1 family nucleobase:cation symporter-1 [Streptomyces muensis]
MSLRDGSYGGSHSAGPSMPPADPDPLSVTDPDPTLYNDDLAPLPHKKRKWGAFAIFNVWSSDIHSLFGYTLAATLFTTSGLNGWWVFTGIILAGCIVMLLVNLTGKPSVKYGIPYPVMARVGMGVRGAQFPALVRAAVAIFWYGVQTYFASTAVALLITATTGYTGSGTFLGMSSVGWLSYVIVAVFQLGLFLRGIDWITRYLNWAGPLVYVVMIALVVIIWNEAGSGLAAELGDIFAGSGGDDSTSVSAFVGVVGTMVAYFAAVIINYGDFARFVKTERRMTWGNFFGLPVSLAFFSFLALVITAGTGVLFGEPLTNPSDIVERVDNTWLTVIAALTFFTATVGINLVANFIPPAYDLTNTSPDIISARGGGVITALVAFVIGALWIPVISHLGLAKFVDTPGALLAPLYGIVVIDYYLIRKQRLNVQDLFSAEPDGAYYYTSGWNFRALAAFALAAVFSVSTVWSPSMAQLTGYAWLFGAVIGGALHYVFMRGRALADAWVLRVRRVHRVR